MKITANIYWELICQDIVWISFFPIILVNLNINSSITTVKKALRLTIRIDTFWEALWDALEGL